MTSSPVSDWLFTVLACPADRGSLVRAGDMLRCSGGHEFPIVQGVPILLLDRPDHTHGYAEQTLAAVKHEAVGLEAARLEAARLEAAPIAMTTHEPQAASGVDTFVQDEIVRTNGFLYSHLRGRLPRYPIPEIRLPAGEGKTLLDVGCNWGRWVFAAARAGYRPVGIDPSLQAALAGRRVAAQLGLDVAFVVADARTLPFANGAFDVAYSYSVLQHFAKQDARSALAEMARVTTLGGKVLVQMPNLLGVRQFYNFVRQVAKQNRDRFRVRYWLPWELRRTFEDLVGPTRLFVDGYFSLNPQTNDLDLLTPTGAKVVRTSEALRRISERIPPLSLVADSLYVEAVNHRRCAAGPAATATPP